MAARSPRPPSGRSSSCRSSRTGSGSPTPPALELADKLTELLPIDVGRIFFVGGGVRGDRDGAQDRAPVPPAPRRADAVRSSSRAEAPTTGRPSARSRSTAAPRCARSSSRCCPAACARRCRYRYRCPYCAEEPACTLRCADEIDDIVVNEGPETVAAVILEPVAELGRLDRSARGLLRARPRDLRRARAPARRRRGHLRLRPRRGLVRVDALRDRARPDDAGEGDHVRLRAARRRRRAPRRRSSRSSRSRRTRSRTGSRSAATRSRARSRSPTSTSSSART